MVKPKIGKMAKVPMSDTGTARSGIRVARQFWRNRKTTIITRTMASTSVVTISFIPSVIGRVVSMAILYSRSWGNRDFNSTICAFT